MEFTNQLVVMSTEEQKASFYRKTYMHVALAILAFIFVETALLMVVPAEMPLDRLFENFINFKEIINHNQYANNYDYNRAIYLLNQEQFWDNNFVMLKEDEKLFSPLSVINFSRYETINDVQNFLSENEENIQCVVANSTLEIPAAIGFGEAQHPELDTYADNIDTMAFLSNL